jgi:hypothetical protein
MLLKLFTTIGKIQNIPNVKNMAIINKFLEINSQNYKKEVSFLYFYFFSKNILIVNLSYTIV